MVNSGAFLFLLHLSITRFSKVIFIEITKVQLENKTFVENLFGFHKRTAESGRESFCRFGALSILVS